jgi:hypothetical protein
MSGPFLTTIADTLYTPEGQAVNGALYVSNPATFETSDSIPFTILRGYTQQVVVTGGAFSVSLIPYDGYSVRVQCTEGDFEQTWNVPRSDTPVTLAEVIAS